MTVKSGSHPTSKAGSRAGSRVSSTGYYCMSNKQPESPLYFCTYQRCREQLDFKTGAWRKYCRSDGKFYGSKPHDCGVPEDCITLSFIPKAEAVAAGFNFVERTTPEGQELAKQTGWNNTDFVFVPPGTELQPRLRPARKGRKHWLDAEHSSQPPLKRQVLRDKRPLTSPALQPFSLFTSCCSG